jgi:hypothetical protein
MTGPRRLLTVLMTTAVGLVLGLVVLAVRGPCLQTDACRLRPDGSCEPGPCDQLPVVPTEVLVCGGIGLLLGLVVVAVVSRR